MTDWIKTIDKLPPYEIDVLIYFEGELFIAQLWKEWTLDDDCNWIDGWHHSRYIGKKINPSHWYLPENPT